MVRSSGDIGPILIVACMQRSAAGSCASFAAVACDLSGRLSATHRCQGSAFAQELSGGTLQHDLWQMTVAAAPKAMFPRSLWFRAAQQACTEAAPKRGASQ